MAGRRSSGDLKWKEVRKIVRARDKVCMLCKVLLPFEVRERNKHLFGKRLNLFQVAHIKPVSTNLELCYNIENLLLLCEHCHYCQDHLIDAISGEHSNQNKEWYYWWRAKFKKTDKYDENINYEELFYLTKKEDKKELKDWW